MWLEDIRRDVLNGVKTLARTPGFTSVAVLTLALGIGAVTAIYSLVRNVVLDPFPYSQSDRLVNVVLADRSGKIVGGQFGAAEFLDYQEQTTVFEGVIGTRLQVAVHALSSAGAERLNVAWMTPNGFAVLGVPPLLGRWFGESDAVPGAPPVAVLSYRTWRRAFGSDPTVVGRAVSLNSQPSTVIGVMPPRFDWYMADAWIPSALKTTDDPRSFQAARAFRARLRPGVSVREAETQLAVVAARRTADNPNSYPPQARLQVDKLIDWTVRDFRTVAYTLFGVVALLLAIACCNVANMLLARATAREREISIRIALGATRAQIIRRLFVESFLLAFAGLALGTVCAYLGIDALKKFVPVQGIPWEAEIRVDEPVLLFALGITGLATFGFGLLPALQSARRDIVTGTRIGGRTGTAGRGQLRLSNSLVVVQVALSAVLLLGAGVLGRTFMQITSVDLGFDPQHVLVTGLVFPPNSGLSSVARQDKYREMVQRVEALPGVLAVAVSSTRGTFTGNTSPLEVAGGTLSRAPVRVQYCSERFPEALGLEVLGGRQMSADEVQNRRPVALINATLAKQSFGGSSQALGREIRLSALTEVADPRFTVIGVVSDSQNVDLRQSPTPHVFVPFAFSAGGPVLVARTANDPNSVLQMLRQQVQSVDAQVALVYPETFEQYLVRAFYERPRFNVLVVGIFACVGAILAMLGTYGVLAYTVSQRTPEFAIRMALGGDKRHVLARVFRLGVGLVAIGLVIGGAMSLLTNRLLTRELWTVSPHDPRTFLVVLGGFLTIAVIACLVPARRAVSTEPMVVLRDE